MLADGVALGHRLDHRLAEVLRMRAREADALDPVDRVAGPQQLAELGVDLRPQVAAPRVDVLAEQRDLPDALAPRAASPRRRSRPAGGSPRGRARPGRCSRRTSSCSPSRSAPTPGSAARGASAASPAKRRSSAIPKRARDAEAAGAEPLAEVRDRARPERDVDVGVEREEPLALCLGVAAADGDHASRGRARFSASRCRGARRTSCRASRGSCRC